jgi:hypothetical protein
MTTVVIAIVLTTNTFIAGAFAAGPQIGTATHGHIDPSQCRFARSDGLRGWTDREVRRTIRCAARRWPVAGGVGKALQVARCESGFETNAYNSGGYAGVFQQAIRYWPDRQRVYDVERWELRPGVFNGRTNVTVSIRMAHRGGWSPWSCA